MANENCHAWRKQLAPAIALLLGAMLAWSPLALANVQDEPDNSESYESAFPDGIYTAYQDMSEPDIRAGHVIFAKADQNNGSAATPKVESKDTQPAKLTSPVQRNGYATYQWINGDSYSGKWKSGAMSGVGKYTYANGGVIEGTFKSNKIIQGKYTIKTKKGTFKLYIKKGSPYKAKIKTKAGFTYTGAYKNKKINGKGIAVYPKGGKYTGSFKNGKRSGAGTYTWKNGAKYKGKWAKDKMSGKGTYYYKKGAKAKKLVGKFKNSKPVGWCKYTTKSGKTYKTYWKNGKCTKVKK